jgi:signal transduction histidine kinase
MSFVANAALAAGVINAILAAFVLYTNPRSTLNRIYALWGGCVSVWNFAAFFKSFSNVAEPQAMVLVGIIQAAVIFLPMTLAHLCQVILYGRTPKWLYGFYALHLTLFASLLFTPYFMMGVQMVPGLGWWSKAGPLFKVYLASYVVLNLQLMYELVRHARKSTRDRRSQLLVLFFSILTLWLCGTNDMMPIVGRKQYPWTNFDFIPLGNFGAIFYGLAVAYSVLHHQLLDIYYAFSRVTSVVLRVGFVVGISLLLLIAAKAIDADSFDAYEMRMALGSVAVSTFVATFLFPKLLGGPVERIERALMGDRFELPDKVRAFIEQMKWTLDLKTVLDALAKFLGGTFRLRGFSVVLLGETRREFSVVRSLPASAPHVLENLQNDGSIFSAPYESGGRFIVLLDPPEAGMPDPQAKVRNELQGLEGRVVFPFRVEKEPLGFLLIGDKQNGAVITAEEARLLSEIAENISLVVNQISLKNQIARAQELDLIGRMSQGMAHDLNNLTTPISTLIQLIDEGMPLESLRAELVPVAKRNITTMRAYIKESLFFTENLRPDLQPLRLDMLVQNVVADAVAAKRKGKTIRYETEICGEVYATLDSVLTMRVLANLISNAVDASAEGGVIRVQLSKLKMEKGREWVRIDVSDNGTGIAPEVKARIFEPYFSTKKTGDEQRGFGLGLAICRKIAALHEGTLVLESELGQGTTFSLDLPCRPNELPDGALSAFETSESRVA